MPAGSRRWLAGRRFFGAALASQIVPPATFVQPATAKRADPARSISQADFPNVSIVGSGGKGGKDSTRKPSSAERV